jgi:hypothetical protein
MNNIKPYVYRCEHKITKQYYIGYRYANWLPADKDLGIHYFTSSVIVSEDFVNYNYEILSEYNTKEWAYETEQRLIYESRNDPLLINKNYKKKNLIELDPKPVVKKHKEKIKCIAKLPTKSTKIAKTIKVSEKRLLQIQKEQIKRKEINYYKTCSLEDLVLQRDTVYNKAKNYPNKEVQQGLLITYRRIVNYIQRINGVR